jgi:phosphoserine aminotransferase
LVETFVPVQGGQQKVAGKEGTTKVVVISDQQVGGKEQKVAQPLEFVTQFDFKVIDDFFGTCVGTDRLHRTDRARQQQEERPQKEMEEAA